MLPENAQLRLLQIRDHLRLLTALARPRDISSPNFDELQVSPDALVTPEKPLSNLQCHVCGPHGA
ncbi:XAC0095 family protein [Xanthomonas oryzae]|uniref:XAC0095 family protein n=1 Tax=Xanthomonas oryzae TaxID=347 RepID=UPI003D01921C